MAWIVFPKGRELQNCWFRLFRKVLPFAHSSSRVGNTSIFNVLKFQKYPIHHTDKDEGKSYKLCLCCEYMENNEWKNRKDPLNMLRANWGSWGYSLSRGIIRTLSNSSIIDVWQGLSSPSRPSIPENCIKIKINWNFYFHTLWCLKRFHEGLWGLHKTFWGTTEKFENKTFS